MGMLAGLPLLAAPKPTCGEAVSSGKDFARVSLTFNVTIAAKARLAVYEDRGSLFAEASVTGRTEQGELSTPTGKVFGAGWGPVALGPAKAFQAKDYRYAEAEGLVKSDHARKIVIDKSDEEINNYIITYKPIND